jgi:hypothetical protein
MTLMGIRLIYGSLVFGALAMNGANFPVIHLDETDSKIVIADPAGPDRFYQGTRFLPAAHVMQFKHGDRVMNGTWMGMETGSENERAAGPAVEFNLGRGGQPMPAGYDDAEVGELFLKPGVGWLRKAADRPYFFNDDYELVNAGEWTSVRSTAGIEWHHRLPVINGQGCDIVVAYQLDHEAAGFTMRITARNTGDVPLSLSMYAHNFWTWPDRPKSTEVEVVLPSEVAAAWTGPGTLRTASGLRARTFDEPAAVLFRRSKGNVSIDQSEMQLGLRRTSLAHDWILSAAPVNDLRLWATEHVICLEPGWSTDLLPGSSIDWHLRYHFALNGIGHSKRSQRLLVSRAESRTR